MAKIGNEAKLILKLAKERAEKRRVEQTETHIVYFPDESRQKADVFGYDRAHRNWLAILDQVVTEIETK